MLACHLAFATFAIEISHSIFGECARWTSYSPNVIRILSLYTGRAISIDIPCAIEHSASQASGHRVRARALICGVKKSINANDPMTHFCDLDI